MENNTQSTKPFLMTRDDAPRYWLVDSLWSLLATADTTDGALTVIDQVMPRRSGPPPHVHERLHEYFYILDGEIRFQLDTELRTATAPHPVSRTQHATLAHPTRS
jgi:quercetin dioxygenase-like cupin family protein